MHMVIITALSILLPVLSILAEYVPPVRTHSLLPSNSILMDVWTNVVRVSDVQLAKAHIQVVPQFKSIMDSVGGWYEGYSVGLPIRNLTMDKVPYGCWHMSWPSNIYANIGNYLVLSKFGNRADEYFKAHLAVKEASEYKRILDKYFCKYAITLGYKSFIIRFFIPNSILYGYEVVVCDGLCGTVSYNNTCAPVPYKQIVQNNSFIPCQCEDQYDALNCKDMVYDPSVRDKVDMDYYNANKKYQFEKQYNKSMEKSPLSNYKNHNCIMGYQHMDYLTQEVENEFRHNDELHLLFSTNMLDFSILDIHEKLVNEVKGLTSNEVMLLNLETENIDFFNTSLKTRTDLSSSSRYHHHQYPAVFQEALNGHLYHRLSNWISPWDNDVKASRKSKILLYSNIDDSQNTGIFIVNNITIGVIMYSTAVFNKLHIISSQQLVHWIRSCS